MILWFKAFWDTEACGVIELPLEVNSGGYRSVGRMAYGRSCVLGDI